MNSEKRKRTDITLEQKQAIIEAAKRESNQTKLARDFTMKWGFEVKRTAVQSILSNKEAFEAAVEEGVPMKRKKLTQANNPMLDEALIKWSKQARGENLPSVEKALTLAELMASLVSRRAKGEAGAVNMRSLLEWQQSVLKPCSRSSPQTTSST
uniref:HTH CENPB-type domain-containing protein n=1 Tax=Ditylenchus dipsaci TaxID=166011 RepID=A0A915EGX2_9BILA